MIGIFDSGLGGLTILRRILNIMPEYDYVYTGDNARVPYGNKSSEFIYEYTRQGVDSLMKQGCQIVIIACSTASSQSLRRLQQEWLPQNYPDRKILGVVIPIAEAAIECIEQEPSRKRPKKNKIGIIGTSATIDSGVFEEELYKLRKDIKVYSQSSPLLVPLVEEGWLKRRETRMILKYYLRPLKRERVNHLILGCTHYPVLHDTIADIMGPQCNIIDPPRPVADKLRGYLEKHPEIKKKISQNKNRTFYTTDDPDKFQKLGPRFLGQPLPEVKKVDLSPDHSSSV